MATFIPNITGAYPEPAALDLDFNRVERMLKLREGLYAQGAKKVKNLYQTAFSSPLLRGENIEKRDQYLKSITDGLKAVSATDLSLPENQEFANTLFEPVTSDVDLVKDIVYTKQYQSEKSRAEEYRKSTDPKTKDMYWGEGLKAMDYQAEEFKNADSKTALSMSGPKYVPNVNIKSLSEKLYKDAGVSVKQDVVKGGYIWTMKNGEAALPITQSIAATMFSQDPAIKDWLDTKAYVRRKDFIKQNAGSFGGDESKAEAAYIKTVIGDIMVQNEDLVKTEDKEVSKLRSEVDSWEKVKTTKGIINGSDDEKKYIETKEKLRIAEESAINRKNATLMQQINDMSDIESVRRAVDNAVSIYSSQAMSNQIATYLAYKNSEVTAKVDPYSLAEFRNNLTGKLEMLRQQNRLTIKNIEAAISSGLEEQKQKGRIELAGIQHQNTIDQIKERAKHQKNGKGVFNLFGDDNNDETPTPTNDSSGTTPTVTPDVDNNDENDDEEPSNEGVTVKG